MVRLMLDFKDEAALADFMTSLRFHDLVPNDSTVFKADALDFRANTGVTTGKTYLLKKDDGTRPEVSKLKIRTVTERTL